MTRQLQIFINNNTQQVVVLPLVRPAVYKFLSVQATEEMLAQSGWFMSDTDPGYRGMPA